MIFISWSSAFRNRSCIVRMVRGSNPGGWRDIPHTSSPALGPTQPLIQWVPGSFPVVKRPGRSVDNLPPSSAEVKERVIVGQYLNSPSGTSWPVLGRTLPSLAALYSTCTLKIPGSNLEKNSCYNMSSRPGTHSFQTLANSSLMNHATILRHVT